MTLPLLCGIVMANRQRSIARLFALAAIQKTPRTNLTCGAMYLARVDAVERRGLFDRDLWH